MTARLLGSQTEVTERSHEKTFQQVIVAGGNAVMPGLVDGHTFPVCVGDMVHNFP